MHEGLVWFPAVARLVKSGPSRIELQSESTIAVAALSKDRLNDEFLLVVLSDSQRIDADRIVDEWEKVIDEWIFDSVDQVRLVHYLEWSAMLG